MGRARAAGIRIVLVVAVTLATAACPRETLACGTGHRFNGVEPLVRGQGSIRAIYATSDVPGDLAASRHLYLRIDFTGNILPKHNVYIDTDGDRMTGMWTLQSSVSAAGWNLIVDDDSRLLVHEGPPTRWNWKGLAAPGFGRTVDGATVDLCIPTSVLAASRVRVGVVAGEEWLPHQFLAGVSYPPAHQPRRDPRRAVPARLAINYSARPWIVRDCTDPSPIDMSCPAEVFGRFAHVALTSGLEEPDHPSHERAAALIAAIHAVAPSTEIWGYVSLAGGPGGESGRRVRLHDTHEVLARASLWKRIGADGIFLDEADLCRRDWGQECPVGPDGEQRSITRSRQIAVVNGIHAMDLAVFANAFSPMNILGEVAGRRSPLGGETDNRPADMYLLENPTVAEGVRRQGLDRAVSDAKFVLAQEARALGVRIAAVDTSSGATDDNADDPDYRYAYERAVRAGVDVYGFTNSSYSASPEVSTNLAIR